MSEVVVATCALWRIRDASGGTGMGHTCSATVGKLSAQARSCLRICDLEILAPAPRSARRHGRFRGTIVTSPTVATERWDLWRAPKACKERRLSSDLSEWS